VSERRYFFRGFRRGNSTRGKNEESGKAQGKGREKLKPPEGAYATKGGKKGKARFLEKRAATLRGKKEKHTNKRKKKKAHQKGEKNLFSTPEEGKRKGAQLLSCREEGGNVKYGTKRKKSCREEDAKTPAWEGKSASSKFSNKKKKSPN